MIKKLACTIILVDTAIRYKLVRRSVSYWEWLSDRINEKQMWTFGLKCIVRFLFLDAIDRGDRVGYCYIYEKYTSILSEKKLPAKYYISLFDASVQLNNRYLANNIKTVIDRDPSYFPTEFINKYEKIYNEGFKT